MNLWLETNRYLDQFGCWLLWEVANSNSNSKNKKIE